MNQTEIKNFINIFIKNFLNKNNNKIYSRKIYLGAVSVERFSRTNRDFLKRSIFERGHANWVDILSTTTKQNDIRVHSCTKSTSVQASLKKNEGFVHENILDKRKKMKPQFEINNLVRVAKTKETFSKSDTTKWSYKLYKITETVKETIPSYEIHF